MPTVTFAPNKHQDELKGPNHLTSRSKSSTGRMGCDSISNTPAVPNAVTITASKEMTHSHLDSFKEKKLNDLPQK